MTILELAERDLRKAKINLKNAVEKRNTPKAELEHLTELLELRKAIFEFISEHQ